MQSMFYFECNPIEESYKETMNRLDGYSRTIYFSVRKNPLTDKGGNGVTSARNDVLQIEFLGEFKEAHRRGSERGKTSTTVTAMRSTSTEVENPKRQFRNNRIIFCGMFLFYGSTYLIAPKGCIYKKRPNR